MPAPTRNHPAVLFVDDEAQARKYFAMAFGDEFPVLTAASVAEAEALLAHPDNRIGVVITDQRMPGENGTALLERVKRSHPTVVRLLTTAYADLTEAVAAVNRGEIHRYILKPWDLAVLAVELQEAMELHRRRCRETDLLQASRRAVRGLALQIDHELTPALHRIAEEARAIEASLAERRARPGTSPAPEGGRDPSQHARLSEAHARIDALTARALAFLRMLRFNLVDPVEETPGQACFSLAHCLREALASYPFEDEQRALVHVSGGDFTVRGREELLTQVIHNLLRNALQALRAAGRGEIHIEVNAERHWLSVRDTGDGIAPNALPRVFEELFTARPPGSGVGMGLPFCRRVMTAIGGTIACHSSPQHGTEVVLSFPTCAEPVATPLSKADPS